MLFNRLPTIISAIARAAPYNHRITAIEICPLESGFNMLASRMAQPTPASQLTGLRLPSISGAIWEVVNLVLPLAGATGSNFSVGYLVRQIQDSNGKTVTNGREAFCKAMDFSRAMSMAVPAQALLDLTQMFVFERSVLEHCRDRDIRRVTRYLDTGTVQIPNMSPPINVVQYIIFEKAEGDLRGSLSRSDIVSWARKMRCLHNLSSAVSQMHLNGIRIILVACGNWAQGRG